MGHANQNITALMIDHLAGEGSHSDPVGQTHIPSEALEGITEAVHSTFLNVPDAVTPQKVFTYVKQGLVEPYMQFNGCLKQALKRQIENDIAREVLLLKLAAENANENCKKLLKSLSKEEPTLL